MDKSIKRGRIFVLGICMVSAVSIIIRILTDFNLFNMIIHLAVIIGLLTGIPKARWLVTGLYGFILVSGLWLLVEMYRMYAVISTSLIVNIVIAIVIIGLLVFNKDVDSYLYYKEVG